MITLLIPFILFVVLLPLLAYLAATGHEPKTLDRTAHARHVWELERDIGWEPTSVFGLDPSSDPQPRRPSPTVTDFDAKVDREKRKYEAMEAKARRKAESPADVFYDQLNKATSRSEVQDLLSRSIPTSHGIVPKAMVTADRCECGGFHAAWFKGHEQ